MQEPLAADEDTESEAETDEEQTQAHGRENVQAAGHFDVAEEDTKNEDIDDDENDDDDSAEYETDSGSGSEYETESSSDDEGEEQKSKLPVSPGGTVGSKAVRNTHWPLYVFLLSMDLTMVVERRWPLLICCDWLSCPSVRSLIFLMTLLCALSLFLTVVKGWVWKESDHLRSWRRRWLICKGGRLTYSKTAPKSDDDTAATQISLKNAHVGPPKTSRARPYCFHVTSADRVTQDQADKGENRRGTRVRPQAVDFLSSHCSAPSTNLVRRNHSRRVTFGRNRMCLPWTLQRRKSSGWQCCERTSRWQVASDCKPLAGINNHQVLL